MKKVIKVIKSYDDLYLAQGQEIEADVEVSIGIGDDEPLTLDVTFAHADELRKDLAKWIRAARPAPARRPRVSHPPVCRHPAEGMTIEEAKTFLAGVRAWADSQGRSSEYWPKGKSSYSYAQRLIDDYNAHLRAELESLIETTPGARVVS